MSFIFLDPFSSILISSCKACASSFSLFSYLQIFTRHLLCARHCSSSWEDSSDIYVLSPLHQNVCFIRAGTDFIYCCPSRSWGGAWHRVGAEWVFAGGWTMGRNWHGLCLPLGPGEIGSCLGGYMLEGPAYHRYLSKSMWVPKSLRICRWGLAQCSL